MKELDKRVNIIPVIAKADTISRPELIQFKKQVCSVAMFSCDVICLLFCFLPQIMQELGSNGIKIYTFPTNEEQVSDLNTKMNVSCVAVVVYCMQRAHTCKYHIPICISGYLVITGETFIPAM